MKRGAVHLPRILVLIICYLAEAWLGANYFGTENHTMLEAGSTAIEVRPSRIPSLCTHFIRAGIEWRR